MDLAASETNIFMNKESRVNNLLVVRSLSCVRNEQLLFEEISFKLSSGEVLQIEGANGSGKTSLLRILCGLALPEEGKVSWNNQDIQNIRSQYAQDMHYVGHTNGIKAELTSVENLVVAQSLTIPRGGCSCEDALAQLEIEELADVPVRKLSSGQRRRVALSRLLISEARLWLMDEPFTSLDDSSRLLVKKIIETHAKTGGLAVIVTHDPLELPGVPFKKITFN
ncbi:MAG: heme ABC transporter ATP-binding protein CcmA [Gammaproteobacteria bacterium]|nr:MAG: heme ABC transporter ATP-binding protein CcmA [Gammaproteobacteria bacterium]RKZ65690.1 MAG: heme ABC transporter ATP-binding protein CcmA [Gammaproteobacteria bacterium]